MPVSKPLQLFTIRLDADEKARLAELARERNITLSYAMREGVRLYLNEYSERREADPRKVRVRATT